MKSPNFAERKGKDTFPLLTAMRMRPAERIERKARLASSTGGSEHDFLT